MENLPIVALEISPSSYGQNNPLLAAVALIAKILFAVCRSVSVFKCFWTMLAVLERRLWLVWGWSLSGFRVVLQSSLLDGVAFDPFSFQEDGPVSAEVDVGGRQVL
jgi:hypothetical protein